MKERDPTLIGYNKLVTGQFVFERQNSLNMTRAVTQTLEPFCPG